MADFAVAKVDVVVLILFGRAKATYLLVSVVYDERLPAHVDLAWAATLRTESFGWYSIAGKRSGKVCGWADSSWWARGAPVPHVGVGHCRLGASDQSALDRPPSRSGLGL